MTCKALHRVRSRLIGNRTQSANQIRGLLAEYGIVLPVHISQLRLHLPLLLSEPHPLLTEPERELFGELYEELLASDERIRRMEQLLERAFRQQPSCQKDRGSRTRGTSHWRQR
jgi:transposase